jgi:hypothetical protein
LLDALAAAIKVTFGLCCLLVAGLNFIFFLCNSLNGV